MRAIFRRRRPTWRVAYHADPGHTLVTLCLVDRSGTVVDEHIVATVPGDAYDRHRHLLQAQLEAEGQAMRLNAAG